MEILLAVALGALLDLLFGDPRRLPHPVVLMGRLIGLLEKFLRRTFPKTAGGEFGAGLVLAILLPAASFLSAYWALALLGRLHPLARALLESFWCFQLLAAHSLRSESMQVFRALAAGDLTAARRAVSGLVGRDTEQLDEAGVIRAAVETVAENTTDGVVAPLLYMAVGGAPLAMLYKAINTMDSMVGYRNETYRHFGTAAARLDDAANFLPARLAGLLMVPAAYLTGLDGRGAWRVFRRDRRKHKSPNSAHTEAACAGALGVQLAGDAVYFGQTVHKPAIGDARRPVRPQDIAAANRLMYAAAALCFVLCEALRLAAVILF